jgi:hypothetical protein
MENNIMLQCDPSIIGGLINDYNHKLLEGRKKFSITYREIKSITSVSFEINETTEKKKRKSPEQVSELGTQANALLEELEQVSKKKKLIEAWSNIQNQFDGINNPQNNQLVSLDTQQKERTVFNSLYSIIIQRNLPFDFIGLPDDCSLCGKTRDVILCRNFLDHSSCQKEIKEKCMSPCNCYDHPYSLCLDCVFSKHYSTIVDGMAGIDPSNSKKCIAACQICSGAFCPFSLKPIKVELNGKSSLDGVDIFSLIEKQAGEIALNKYQSTLQSNGQIDDVNELVKRIVGSNQFTETEVDSGMLYQQDGFDEDSFGNALSVMNKEPVFLTNVRYDDSNTMLIPVTELQSNEIVQYGQQLDTQLNAQQSAIVRATTHIVSQKLERKLDYILLKLERLEEKYETSQGKRISGDNKTKKDRFCLRCGGKNHYTKTCGRLPVRASNKSA